MPVVGVVIWRCCGRVDVIADEPMEIPVSANTNPFHLFTASVSSEITQDDYILKGLKGFSFFFFTVNCRNRINITSKQSLAFKSCENVKLTEPPDPQCRTRCDRKYTDVMQIHSWKKGFHRTVELTSVFHLSLTSRKTSYSSSSSFSESHGVLRTGIMTMSLSTAITKALQMRFMLWLCNNDRQLKAEADNPTAGLSDKILADKMIQASISYRRDRCVTFLSFLACSVCSC